MASTSSPSQPSAYRQYDVFLSHHGPDAKNTLASHIYHTLARCEVTAFLDKYEMNPGEWIPAQIEDAIRNASFHIPIFSKGYANSRWCLDELCWMMESGAEILPVFYGVEPSDLRTRDGLYAKALQTHTEQKRDGGTPKYDSQKIQKWKKALCDLRLRSGLELKACSGDEGLLGKKIVDNVLRHVNRKLPDVGDDHLVGLTEQALHFEEEMLSHGGPHVHVVGIVGMGGAGKTTLAAHIFNNKRSKYHKGCRLFNVRSQSPLTDLQSKLLADLTGSHQKIYSVWEGREILKRRVRSCKALIMLDDIDDVDQLDALLVVKDVLSSGSLILVTSRNIELLESSQISIYKIRSLNDQDAQKLFCWRAFLRPFPLEGYEDLVQKFLTKCSGLPLSLRVFGGLFRDRDDDKGYWERQLGRIPEILDEHNIKKNLKVSYDALGNNVKEMFLDAACFFIGVDKGSAVKIWEGCRWNGLDGFETLEKRCLVTLDEENCIRMHDHLRDLGRDIAEEDPSKPRRLWRPGDIDDLLERRCTTMQVVRGIHSTSASRPFIGRLARFTVDTSIKRRKPWIQLVGNCVEFWCHRMVGRSDVSGLQLLVVEGDSFRSILGNASRDLLWLRWHQCPYAILPPWLSMDNLRVLELIGGHFQTLWQTCQIPNQLRELTLVGNLSKLPNSIGALQHLEKIVLNRSDSIESLPDDFCRLRSLRYLQLMEWTQLRSLPEELGKLTNLQYLDLTGCHNLQRLPKSFSRLMQLRHLVLDRCFRLRIQEEFLGERSTLERVNFRFCRELKVLPTGITRQAFLKEINLLHTSLMELPNEIGDLNSLKVLRLGSKCLKRLPPSIWKLSGLTTLELNSCTLLNSLPERGVGDEGAGPGEKYTGGIGHLKNLEDLEISGCCPLRNVVPFTSVLRKNIDLKEPSRPLHNLKYLTLKSTEISNISLTEDVCPHLRSLKLLLNSNLVDVEVSLPTLEALDLWGCSVLKRITGLSDQPKLSHLRIEDCGELEDLPHLESMSCVEYLNVCGCSKLKAIRGVAHLRSLETLNTDGCFELHSVVGLGQLERLEHLRISAGNGAIWNSIEFLKGFTDHIHSVHNCKAVLKSCDLTEPRQRVINKFRVNAEDVLL